ncbi:MAG TPA: pseudouridine synthase [Casimicrobiaceae bacterium]
MQQPSLALQRIAESLPPPKHKRSTDEVFSEPQRLHKVLAACGFGSRRAMEEMILAGRITVNRMPAEVGQKVGPADEVRINGEVVKVRFAEPRARVLIYHKPAGEIVTRDDPEGRVTVFEKLPSIGNGKWINVGRLDYNTEGLLLFTNSGELANRLMHPRYEVDREYAVRVMGRLTDEQRQALLSGITLDDGIARCQSVEDAGGDDDASNHWYRVVLREGRNREVRRLFEALGVMVSRLIRTRYGVVAMPTSVKRGEWLELEPAAVHALVESAGLSQSATSDTRDMRPPRPNSGKDGRRHGQPQHGAPHVQPRTHGAPGSAPRPHHKSSKPGFRPQGKGPGHPPHAAHSGNGRFSAPQPHQPQRPRSNFDEVQPQSNANASPFATPRNAGSGQPHRGFGAPNAPRHRSGPRAQAAGFGGGQKGPGGFAHRHARRPDKPRAEVNGNVASAKEGPPPSDDED